MDVQQAELRKQFNYPDGVVIRGYKPEIKINPIQLKRVVNLLDQAEKPLICAGGGVILGNGEQVQVPSQPCLWLYSFQEW